MKIYLAMPYTGNENQSFHVANLVAGLLMRQGHIVFSPISHTHPIAVECNLPKDWDYWKRFDEEFIGFCDEVHVVKLNGFEKSKGVNTEIEITRKLEKPIKYIGFKNEIAIEFPL